MVPLGLVGEVFGVRTQVDCYLTTVSTVDRRLGLIKNLGRHIYCRAAPSLRIVVKTLHLPRSTAAILDLRAQGTGDGPRGTRGGYGTVLDSGTHP
jgi:hypothetical protein